MRIFRHLLFGLGLLVAVLVWFIESPEPTSWIGHTIAPRYLPAIKAYRLLLGRPTPLPNSDQGFAELLELVTINVPRVEKEHVAALRFAGLGFTPSGNGIVIECLDTVGQKIDAAEVFNPEAQIKEHFFDKKIRQAKWALSLVALVLSAIMYVSEIVERRRRERRDGAERTRVNRELATAQAELSDVKAGQDPNRLFDAVKREAESQERRGGPKSPFRRQ